MSNPLFTLVHYLDVSDSAPSPSDAAVQAPAPPVISEEQIQKQIQDRIDEACRREREATEDRVTQRLTLHYEQQLTLARATFQQTLANTIQDFATDRSAYFARAESELVQLALSIARKILQREAQLDPLLLAGLVRVALDGMIGDPAVTLRVAPAQLALWQQHTAGIAPRHAVTLCPDHSLAPDECTLESSSGTARLSYEVQLKEVERGFLDLLGLRPAHSPAPISAAGAQPA